MIWACGNAPAGSEERQTCTWKQTASNLPAGFVVSAGPCPPCDWALCAEAAGGGCELLWWRTSCCQVGLEGSSPAALGPCLWRSPESAGLELVVPCVRLSVNTSWGWQPRSLFSLLPKNKELLAHTGDILGQGDGLM